MNIEERKAMIQTYTDKPWKRINLATSLIAFSLDEGVDAALDKAILYKTTLEEIIAASKDTVDEAPARHLLKSVNLVLTELLD